MTAYGMFVAILYFVMAFFATASLLSIAGTLLRILALLKEVSIRHERRIEHTESELRR